jgi:hypothetical protein
MFASARCKPQFASGTGLSGGGAGERRDLERVRPAPRDAVAPVRAGHGQPGRRSRRDRPTQEPDRQPDRRLRRKRLARIDGGQLPAAAGQRGWIGAQHLEAGLSGAAEARLGGHRPVEGVEGDDAADLPARAARPHVPEVAAHVTAPRHQYLSAEEEGRDQPSARPPPRVDLPLDELPQHEGALRVADQHDATVAVEPSEVGAPRLTHVKVRALPLLRRDGHRSAQRRQRDLAIHRGVHPALARVAGGLVERDRAQLGIDPPVRRRRGLVAHGRVDVEAVEARAPGGPQVGDAEPLSGGRIAVRRWLHGAWVVLLARLAQPHRPALAAPGDAARMAPVSTTASGRRSGGIGALVYHEDRHGAPARDRVSGRRRARGGRSACGPPVLSGARPCAASASAAWVRDRP